MPASAARRSYASFAASSAVPYTSAPLLVCANHLTMVDSAVIALLAEGHGAAKRRVDALLKAGLPPVLTEPVLYAVGGGRSKAKDEP